MCPRPAARDALFLQEPMQIATLVNTHQTREGAKENKRQRKGNGETLRREGREGVFEATLRPLAMSRILSGFNNKASRQVAVFGAANHPESPVQNTDMLLKLTNSLFDGCLGA